jgi:hypothetical protein
MKTAALSAIRNSRKKIVCGVRRINFMKMSVLFVIRNWRMSSIGLSEKIHILLSALGCKVHPLKNYSAWNMGC